MKKKSIKEFFRQKKVAAGCVAAAVIIAAGSFGINWQSQDAVVFPSYTDPVIETSLTGDDTPLASKPKVTTKKKTSTKTTKKKVKLKKASKKSYTKKLPTKQKTSTKTKKANKTTTVQTAEPPAAIIEEPDTGIEEPPEEPIQTEPICTEPAPVLTTTAVETNAIEEPETTTTTFRGVATYGSLFDFQYARWNGVHYQTDYSAVSYEDLDDLAGFSVAIQSESDRVYTILVYPIKGYSIQDCIAVQYAGDEDYFYFYAIS